MKEKTEHGLRDFSPLLGTNPRLMKRVINTFNILRTIGLSSGFDVNLLNKHLALWIILELRWPKLADYLSEHPESIKRVGTDIKENDISDELKKLKKLLENEEVKKVVTGEGIGISLDENSLRKFAELRV